MCDFVDVDRPAPASLPTLPAGSSLIVRNMDYAANILYLLGFLSCGDGGKEAERILGFLGMPNATTMEKKMWSGMESSVAPAIKTLTEELLQENIAAAVEVFFSNKEHNGCSLFEQWEEGVKLPEELWPQLTVSADMGWQKRSSGRRHDSNSGHTFLCDKETRKPLALDVRSEICSVCSRNKTGQPAREHECMINHTGSSGSVEPLATLEMVVKLFDDKKVVPACLIIDDDSSIKAKLKWSNADWKIKNNTAAAPKIVNSNDNLVSRPDHGRLPTHTPEPNFVADPNHRKKTLEGDLCRKLSVRKEEERCGLTKVDIIRVVTNYARMMRKLPNVPKEDWLEAAKAVVEHHFDNHAHCGKFCLRKVMSAEAKAASKKIYRSKTKDKELYRFLLAALARFVTMTALEEVGHGGDALVNESLNNLVAWFAPKNKTCAGTTSLVNRISVAFGIHSVGAQSHCERLFTLLGIAITPDVRYYLSKQQQTRQCRINKHKKKEVKKERNRKLHEKLQEHSNKVSKAMEKEGALCAPGIGMDGGHCQPTGMKQKAAPSPCTGAGHSRPWSKKCPMCETCQREKESRNSGHTDPAPELGDADAQDMRDSHEQNLMDAVGFGVDDQLFADQLVKAEDLQAESDEDTTSAFI